MRLRHTTRRVTCATPSVRTFFHALAITTLALVLVLVGCASAPEAQVTLGGTEVRVLVADTSDERARGLQGRRSLDPGEGMLFVFDDLEVRTFAMKEVTFPIDVVFIGADMRVTAIESLDPGDTRHVTGPAASAYVLELPQGWAEAEDIGIGSVFAVAGEHR